MYKIMNKMKNLEIIEDSTGDNDMTNIGSTI